MDTIKQYYTDPSIGLSSKEKLRARLKKDGVSFSKKDLDDFYANLDIAQRNKPLQHQEFKRITAAPRCYQLDVMFVDKRLAIPINKNVEYILIVIEILSRRAFLYPLRNNTQQEIIYKYQQFWEDVDGEVEAIFADDQFNKTQFLDLNHDLGVFVQTIVANDEHIVKNSGNRLGIIDRFCRTIKNLIRHYVETTDQLKYIDKLPTLLENYNNNPHRSLHGNSPNDVWDDEDLQSILQHEAFMHNSMIKTPKFNVGDSVRILIASAAFAKEGYTYTKDIFKITEVDGNSVKLEGKRRSYKPQELQLVNPDTLVKVAGSAQVVLQQRQREIRQNRTIRQEGIEPANVVDDTRRTTRKMARELEVQKMKTIEERKTEQRALAEKERLGRLFEQQTGGMKMPKKLKLRKI